MSGKLLGKVSRRSVLAAALVVAIGCQGQSSPRSLKVRGLAGIGSGDSSFAVSTDIPTPESAIRLVRSDFKTNEVKTLCDAAIDRAKAALDKIARLAPAERNIENTLLAYEEAMANLSDETSPLTFMGYVSTDAQISQEGSACEERLGAEYVTIQTRRDLYNAIKAQAGRSPAESRLLEQTLLAFELNGLKLADDQLRLVKDLQTQLSQKTAKFSSNNNNDKTTIEVTSEELAGAPADFIARLKPGSNGRLIVTTKSTDYTVVMENCAIEQTRKKMQFAYLNRGGEENTRLLEEAVVLRQRIAQLLGFETWADYRTKPRMAKNTKNVMEFLDGLRAKLAERNRQDFAQLLKFKKELDPTATALNQWDVAYYANQLKKRDYSVDDEKVREYFPADVVIEGMFSVYSEMLGVNYKEVAGAKVWAEGVKLYEIRDQADNRLIGFFYTDFIPRPGKYGHAAAFPQISGRRLPGGYYSFPVAAVVANMTPPSNGRPSLLQHHEVETIFHEFGHIMHQTLTRAPYASLSGAGVAQDFVEAPSQMLENWVWQPEVLKRLSGYYTDHSQKLPDDLLKRMMAAKDFLQGNLYTKQLLYGTFDMKIHTQQGAVDVTRAYDDLYREIMGQEPIQGGHFPASFGHLMGGYDAGYYGYLWSKVYAQDMFSIFKAGGVTSPEIGGRYRRVILERGNMQDATELLTEFLGRAPSSDAFYKDLHI